MSMVINNNPNASASASASASSPSSLSSSSVAFRPTGFLEQCFLCNTKLSPGKDIYMYRGDRAFCSEECRCRQILLDEKDHAHCSVGERTIPHPSSSKNRTHGQNATSGGV